MNVEISLTYECGCVEVFGPVSTLPLGEGRDLLTVQLCPPEDCQQCLRWGKACATRQGMGPAYEAIAFVDVAPKSRRYTRVKAVAS